MLIVDKLKGNLYTRIKKHMTKKMYHLYYRENREASQSKEEYEANLLRAYRHLDACRFKNKGWPCPTCPSCCFCGKDYETMTEVMDFAREWMKENPDKARFMKPPKFLHKHWLLYDAIKCSQRGSYGIQKSNRKSCISGNVAGSSKTAAKSLRRGSCCKKWGCFSKQPKCAWSTELLRKDWNSTPWVSY